MDPQEPNRKRWLRPLLIGGMMALIVMQIVALTPSDLEEPRTSTASVDPAELMFEGGKLATGIPRDRIPDYSVERFNYVSTQSGRKQWKLVAKEAFLYNREKLVHAQDVTAYLYEPDGKATVVTGLEAKYFMNQKDLELFGNVVTRFPDGFVTKSPYLRYRPDIRRIEIPAVHPVQGDGQAPEGGQTIHFDSQGLDFAMERAEILLPRSVRFTLTPAKSPSTGPHEVTLIESDRCVIHRDRSVAHFSMAPETPLDRRFVRITQATMDSRSRRADLNYGSGGELLQYLVAYEDVLIQEKGKGPSLRYGTGGKAEFDSRRNIVTLREFPQVYQDNDTVTGDTIIVHRDTDIVEVEHSNAFSSGEQTQPAPGSRPGQSPQSR